MTITVKSLLKKSDIAAIFQGVDEDRPLSAIEPLLHEMAWAIAIGNEYDQGTAEWVAGQALFERAWDGFDCIEVMPNDDENQALNNGDLLLPRIEKTIGMSADTTGFLRQEQGHSFNNRVQAEYEPEDTEPEFEPVHS